MASGIVREKATPKVPKVEVLPDDSNQATGGNKGADSGSLNASMMDKQMQEAGNALADRLTSGSAERMMASLPVFEVERSRPAGMSQPKEEYITDNREVVTTRYDQIDTEEVVVTGVKRKDGSFYTTGHINHFVRGAYDHDKFWGVKKGPSITFQQQLAETHRREDKLFISAMLIGPSAATAAVLAPLISAEGGIAILSTKFGVGFGLGYGGATLTGTESTKGRVLAGIVGGTSIVIGSPTAEMLNKVVISEKVSAATAAVLVSGIGGATGELVGQYGDMTTNKPKQTVPYRTEIEPEKIWKSAAISMTATVLFGEMAIAAGTAVPTTAGVLGGKLAPGLQLIPDTLGATSTTISSAAITNITDEPKNKK